MRSVSAPVQQRRQREQPSLLTIESFETAETYLYKLAVSEGVASTYIHIDNIFSAKPRYTNVDELLRKAYSQGVKLESAKDYLASIGVQEPRSKASDILLDVVVKKNNLTGSITKPRTNQQRDALLEAIAQITGSYNPKAKLQNYQSKHTKYLDSVRKTMAKDKILADQIYSVHDQYLKAMNTSKLSASDIRVIEEKLELDVTSNIGVEDILSVFDSIVLTEKVKHAVCFASHETVYQKVYNDAWLSEKDVVNIEAHKLPERGSVSPCIVFVVNIGAVYEVVYTIGAKKLYLKVKHRHKKDVLDAIKEILHHVDYTVNVVKVESVVRLYPVIDTQFISKFYYLLHRTTTNPEYYQFFLNESTSPYPKKSQLKLRYRPRWRYSATPFLKEEAYVVMSSPQTATGNNYIEIAVTAQSMASTLRMFTSFIPAIVTHYALDLVGVSSLAPLYDNKIKPEQPQKKLSSAEVKKQLIDMWPTVFSEAYLKIQPKNMVITTTDEATRDRWVGEIVLLGDSHYDRQVLPFPPAPEPAMFWFTSYNARSKYVGYADNLHDENPTYDKMPHSGESEGTAYSSSLVSTKGSKSKSTPGPREQLQGTEVLDVLVGLPVTRLGTKFVSDSVLHAIAMYELSEFGDSRNVQARANEIREILASYRPELYAQELYDMTDDQIVDGILNKDSFFDPAMYIAGIRKYLGQNVYVIEMAVDANNTSHKFLMPRHSQFYTATSHRSKSIVLCMNYGIKSDKLLYPHCELVVASPEKHTDSVIAEDITKGALFGSEESDRLNDMMLSCTTQVPYYNHSTAYKSKYMISYVWGFLLAKRLKPVSQYIDGYGKARAFTVVHQEKRITIICSPCPPMNLPRSDKIHPTTIEVFESLCESKCVGRSDLGVWCVDSKYDELLYVRLETGKIPKNIPLVGADPIPRDQTHKGEGSSRQAAYDRRLATVLRELMKWLFEMYCHELRRDDLAITPDTVSEFVTKYLTYARPEHTSQYVISKVSEKLPSYGTVKEVLAYLTKTGVYNVSRGKVVLHNEAFMKSMVYYLSTLVKSVIHHDHIGMESTYIRNYYVSLYDFKQHANVELLAGTDNPISIVSPQFAIVQSLLPEHRNSKTPIVYATSGVIKTVMYIVQATRLGKIGNAVDVCMHWDKAGRNIGYLYNEVNTIPDKDIIIYRIVAGRLVEYQYIESEDPEANGFYEVVVYNHSEDDTKHCDYGALLRI